MSEDECEYYSISMQQGEGHACDYAYTHAQWTSGGSPGAEDATNFPDLPAVSDPCSGQNTACRTTLQMGCRFEISFPARVHEAACMRALMFSLHPLALEL